jgi:hypothetical protein
VKRAELICFSMGTSGWLLWTRYRTFALLKILINSWADERLVAPQEEFSFTELSQLVETKDIRIYPCAYLIKHHAMETFGERTYSSIILKLSNRWRWTVCFTHQLLYSRGRTRLYPWVHGLGDGVGTKGGLDAAQKKTMYWPCRETNSGRIACSLFLLIYFQYVGNEDSKAVDVMTDEL